ncbi:uncharacterized protein LOC121431909 [Lytechinus variegatus]|uniref:uncharacterized protein LOC121431909 n=1 Tax=Lytechinus variegatus TaxID=7654 RepID=UPI001BB1B230|nr:uncharacterized protein LOC121431909 [Lytechinus variegatus]
MSKRETSVRMTSLKGATRDEDLHSQVSGSSSRRSRLSRRSSRSSKSELSARKASLEAKKENESKMLMLLKEDKEAKQAFHQNRKAVLEQKMKTLELEQEDMENAYLSEQKAIAAQKSIVAADIEISELAILEECCEDDSETDDEVSIKGLTREKRSERMERFFGSQEEVTVKNIKPESPVVNTPPVSSPAVQARQDTAASSLEDCLQQLARFVAGQNAASNQLAVFSQLPKIDVPIFSGDPLQYTLWKNAFDCTVDSKPIGEQYKLNYLNAYVSGKAKEIVEHHLLIGGSNAYQEALKQLEDRFGDPNTISVSYTKKLTSWPKISSHDASGLRDFADFLQKVVAAKRRVRNLGILDYPQENVKLVEKLPGYLEGKWRDEIDRWRSHKGPQSFPSFTEFAEFVMRAASKANIPEMEPLSKEPKRSFQTNQRSMKARTFVTNGQDNEPSKLSKVSHRHGLFSMCPFCERDHHIEDCDDFAQNSIHVKKAFFRKKMICLGCGGTDDHFVRNCQERKSCKLCGKMHLTCLHYDQNKPDTAELQEGTSHCTSVCLTPDQDGRDHSMIVPVWVRHVDRPSEETLEYAILDDQSNVSFVSKRLCKKLDVKGEKTNLLLTTMHQTGKIESERIKGLEVLDFNKENVIQLPTTLSRDSLPASRSQIPKPEVVKQWDHLNSVASKMMPYRKDVEVSLLIGNDCTRAVRPREIISGNEDDPYAQRSLLGWGVVGRVRKTPGELKSATCNKISVNSCPNSSFQTKVKTNIGPEKIIQALEADFKEEKEGRPSLSVHDVRSPDILEEGITRSQDGNYEMPAPFKSDQVQVPDNRPLAVKRWNQLNIPHLSHIGGVWERQIATFRRTLEPLLISSGNQLDDESFRTFLKEVELVVNSRPLSTTHLCSPDAPEPLTPNHLLTMKPKIVLPPPGKFQTADSYCRKWWRRVQHLSNEFWLRWRKEFLAELQTRQKWVTPKRSVRAGDVVIVKEEGEFRGNWPLGRVEKVLPSKDGHVRKVQLMMANKCLDEDGRRKGQPTILDRPIHKLVVLIPIEETSQGRMQSEDQRIPDQGASQEENKK